MKHVSINSLHLFILCNLAIAQPLLELLSGNPEFFVAHQATAVDIVALLLALCLVAPLCLVLLEGAIFRISAPAYRFLHLLLLTLLAMAIALPVLSRNLALPGSILVGASAVFGILFVYALTRITLLQLFLTFMSPAILVIPGIFLLTPVIYSMVFPSEEAPPALADINASTPVILVVFDEFSVIALMDENLQIDRIRYPNFAALADDGFWFRNATTVSDDTVKGAVPAILTGQYPIRPLAAIEQSTGNLFTLLGGSYRLAVQESYTRLCPEFLCPRREKLVTRLSSLFSDLGLVYLHVLLPSDLTTDLPRITHNWRDFWPTEVGDEQQAMLAQLGMANRHLAFRQFVEAIGPSEQPTLYYQHILLPHVPWAYLPSGEMYDPGIGFFGMPGLSPSEQWSEDNWAVTQGHQRYLLQTGFVDQLVGDLVRRLKDQGLYQSSLLILTADHGVSFRANQSRRQLDPENYLEILHVPLFVKPPHMTRGITSDRNVQSIDILPTIADALNIRTPWAVDGISLLDNQTPLPAHKTVFLQNRREDNERRNLADAGLAALASVAARQTDQFGSGTWSDKLLRVGPYNQLIGRPVDELNVVDNYQGPVHLRLILDSRLTRRTDIPANQSIMPVTGILYVETLNEPRPNIAIGVNGRIAAVTRPFFTQNQHAEFSAFMPDPMPATGEATLSVFLVSGPDSNPQLARLVPR